MPQIERPQNEQLQTHKLTKTNPAKAYPLWSTKPHQHTDLTRNDNITLPSLITKASTHHSTHKYKLTPNVAPNLPKQTPVQGAKPISLDAACNERKKKIEKKGNATHLTEEEPPRTGFQLFRVDASKWSFLTIAIAMTFLNDWGAWIQTRHCTHKPSLSGSCVDFGLTMYGFVGYGCCDGFR